MFTSIRNDPIRIEKEMQISSFSGRYALEVPGPGTDLPFIEDTQIRLQTWGANRCSGMTNVESDLLGLTRNLTRDEIWANDYKRTAVQTQPIKDYRVQEPYTLESRASHPAWVYRDMEYQRWESPFINPQENLEKPFHSNINTRILEKDYFVRKT